MRRKSKILNDPFVDADRFQTTSRCNSKARIAKMATAGFSLLFLLLSVRNCFTKWDTRTVTIDVCATVFETLNAGCCICYFYLFRVDFVGHDTGDGSKQFMGFIPTSA